MALHRRQTIGVPTDGFSAVWNVLFTLAFFAAAGYGVYWCISNVYKKADDEVAKTPPSPVFSRRSKSPAPPSEGPPPPAFPERPRPQAGNVSADVVPPPPTGKIKITSQFALEIQNKILSLPQNELLEVERKQIERVLGCGEATQEEYAMLTRRMRGAVAGSVDMELDRTKLAQHLARLTPILNASPVPEAVITTDGRRFVGSVFSDTPEGVTVNTVIGYVMIPRAEVKRVINMKDMRDEFNRRVAVAHEYRDALPLLFQWTKEMEMPVHREYVAVRMLQQNPLDYAARTVAGYKQGADGNWTVDKAIAFGAPIPVRKPTTRDEVRTELETMGFMLRSDRWYTRSVWTTGIDTLHKPSDVRITYAGTQIFSWHEEDSPKARLFNPTGKPKDGSPPRLRFIAPQGNQGTVTLTIEAPGEIFECKVKANGGIVEAGHNARLEAFLVTDLGKPVLLYDIDSGGDQNAYDVTSHLRGKKKFAVTARITTTKDPYHTYARFLTSLPDSKEAFLVQGIVLRPAPEIDKAWMNAR